MRAPSLLLENFWIVTETKANYNAINLLIYAEELADYLTPYRDCGLRIIIGDLKEKGLLSFGPAFFPRFMKNWNGAIDYIKSKSPKCWFYYDYQWWKQKVIGKLYFIVLIQWMGTKDDLPVIVRIAVFNCKLSVHVWYMKRKLNRVACAFNLLIISAYY